MALRTLILSMSLLSIASAWPAQSLAQFGYEQGKVSGTGIVPIKRPAEMLRLHVQLTGHGKDAKEALANLKTRRDTTIARLVELGAVKESVKAGDPRVAMEDASRRRQMEMMVRERLRQQGRRADKKAEARPVLLSLELKAEWPLSGADGEQLLIAAHKIQELVRAELAKLSETEESSAEEEEMAEEMAMMGNDDGQPKPGEPAFVFVARISDEERSKALTAAFEKAKAQATELSKAANVKLGPLEHLASTQTSAAEEDPYESYRYNPYMAQMMRRQAMMGGDEDATEAIGADPSQVTVTISVVASFGLQE